MAGDLRGLGVATGSALTRERALPRAGLELAAAGDRVRVCGDRARNRAGLGDRPHGHAGPRAAARAHLRRLRDAALPRRDGLDLPGRAELGLAEPRLDRPER